MAALDGASRALAASSRAGVSAGPLGGHLWHILLLASWVPVFGVIVGLDRLKARRSASRQLVPAPSLDRSRWTQAMAVASVCAALVHIAVMPDHFAQSAWYGGFFLAAAVSQLALAAMLLARPSRTLAKAGVAGCAAVVALWLVTRLVGVPIGPDNGSTEPFGVLDILASVAEAAAAVSGLLALRSWTGRPLWRMRTWTVPARVLATACVVGTVAASVLSSRS